jgi:hypothetical protein
MNETNKGHESAAPAPGIGDRATAQQNRLAIRDIHPLPGTPEAKALGCTCSVGGTSANGEPLYAMTKGCPVRNHG